VQFSGQPAPFSRQQKYYMYMKDIMYKTTTTTITTTTTTKTTKTIIRSTTTTLQSDGTIYNYILGIYGSSVIKTSIQYDCD
jgi:hypothetical protein